MAEPKARKQEQEEEEEEQEQEEAFIQFYDSDDGTCAEMESNEGGREGADAGGGAGLWFLVHACAEGSLTSSPPPSPSPTPTHNR